MLKFPINIRRPNVGRRQLAEGSWPKALRLGKAKLSPRFGKVGVVIASLSALKIVGKPIRGMNRRPLEPSFQYGADHAGLVPAEGVFNILIGNFNIG